MVHEIADEVGSAALNLLVFPVAGVCIMIILKLLRQQRDGSHNRRFLQWQGVGVRDAELKEESGIMTQSVGSSISTRPDLNIDPAVADRPRGSGRIGHGIDLR